MRCTAAYPGAFTGRRTPWPRQPRAATAVVATTVVATVFTVAACGGATSTDVIQTPPVDTSTLAGTWLGTVDGGNDPNSYGFSRITTLLKADSTISVAAENPKYGDGSGTWTVSGTQYTATIRDRDGVIVTFVAPLSPLRLTGTWTATSRRTGNFTMAKVP